MLRILFKKYFKISNRLKALLVFNKFLYKIVIDFIKWYFLHWKEIELVFVRQGIARGDLVPGDSDIDLGFIIKDLSLNEERIFIQHFWKKYYLLREFLPILGDVEIYSVTELKIWYCSSSIESRRFDAIKEIQTLTQDLKPESPCRIGHINQITYTFVLFYDMFYFGKISSQTCSKFILKTYKALLDLQFNGGIISANRGRVKELLKEQYPLVLEAIQRIEKKDTVFSSDPDTAYVLNYLDEQISKLVKDVPINGGHFHAYKIYAAHECKTQQILTKKLEDFKKELNRKIPWLQMVLLKGGFGTISSFGDYNFKLYLVGDLKNHTFSETVGTVSEIISSYLPQWPYNYFGMISLPIIISKEMFHYLVQYVNPLDAVLFNGADQQLQLNDFIRNRVIYNLFLPLLINIRNFPNKPPFIVRNSAEDKGTELSLIDSIFSLMGQRLFIERNIIGCSVTDITLAFMEEFKEEPFSNWVKEFHHAYAGLEDERIRKIPGIMQLYEESYEFIFFQREKILQKMILK